MPVFPQFPQIKCPSGISSFKIYYFMTFSFQVTRKKSNKNQTHLQVVYSGTATGGEDLEGYEDLALLDAAGR